MGVASWSSRAGTTLLVLAQTVRYVGKPIQPIYRNPRIPCPAPALPCTLSLLSLSNTRPTTGLSSSGLRFCSPSLSLCELVSPRRLLALVLSVTKLESFSKGLRGVDVAGQSIEIELSPELRYGTPPLFLLARRMGATAGIGGGGSRSAFDRRDLVVLGVGVLVPFVLRSSSTSSIVSGIGGIGKKPEYLRPAEPGRTGVFCVGLGERRGLSGAALSESEAEDWSRG